MLTVSLQQKVETPHRSPQPGPRNQYPERLTIVLQHQFHDSDSQTAPGFTWWRPNKKMARGEHLQMTLPMPCASRNPAASCNSKFPKAGLRLCETPVWRHSTMFQRSNLASQPTIFVHTFPPLILSQRSHGKVMAPKCESLVVTMSWVRLKAED